MRSRGIVYFFILFTGLFLSANSAEIYVPENSDRIIFIGDSITAQGQLHARGWGSYVREAMETAKVKSNVVLLGGSGHTIGSWTSVEKRSRDNDIFLDSKKLNIGKELDKGAKVLVIMLGMNDVLGPYLKGDQASVDDWGKRYVQLVNNFQARVKAKQVCLATVTMCTEDLNSYKNQLVDKLNKKIHQLADENGYSVASTSDRYKDAFHSGRDFVHNFHIMGDYVHPNSSGHIAIALGMVQGLKKAKEAEYLKSKYFDSIGTKEAAGKPGISLDVMSSEKSTNGLFKYKIRYNAFNFSSPKTLKVVLPEGWKSSKASLTSERGFFEVTGLPDKLQNEVTLKAEDGIEKSINIIAPWLIKWGVNQPNWNSGKLPLGTAFETEIDKAVNSGTDLSGDDWIAYHPGYNYTGGENSGSVDFAAVTVCKPFDAGYGVRWIKSSKDRKAILKVSSQIFAGNIYLTVWVNKVKAYQDEITGKKGRKDQVEINLKEGWNRVVFKSNRIAWQWQQSVEILPVDGDSLDDLRYSIEKK